MKTTLFALVTLASASALSSVAIAQTSNESATDTNCIETSSECVQDQVEPTPGNDAPSDDSVDINTNAGQEQDLGAEPDGTESGSVGNSSTGSDGTGNSGSSGSDTNGSGDAGSDAGGAN